MDALRALADRHRGQKEISSLKTLPATSQQSLVSPPLSREAIPETPAKILHPDILSAIFIYLTNGDLSRCLRVNHLFFDLAGKILYSGLVYGRDSAFRTGCLDILTGAYGPGGRISSSKAVLLSHVRTLVFHAHLAGECRHAPQVNLLPSLNTLAIVYSLGSNALCFTSCNFLRYLRPKPVQLFDIRPNQAVAWHINLADDFGLSAERVSLYSHEFHPVPQARPVAWPPAMRQLDIHFWPPQPYSDGHQPQPRLRPVSERHRSEQAIGALLASASKHDAKLRVMGRGVNGPSWDVAPESDGSIDKPFAFVKGVRESCKRVLRDGGVDCGEADRRAAEVEFVMVPLSMPS